MAKIIFKTGIDNSGLEKDLKDAKRDVEKNNKELAKAEQAKIPLNKELDELSPKLDLAKKKLHDLKIEQESIGKAMLPGADPEKYIEAASRKKSVEADIKTQEKATERLQKSWDTVSKKVEGYDAKIKAATDALQANKSRVGTLEAKLSKNSTHMAEAMAKVEKSAQSFSRRILTLGKRILIFSVVASAFRAIKNYMSQLLNTNEQYTAQLAQLKGALMTAFQPIYEAALPGLLKVLEVLTQIVQMAARLISALFGKTAAESAKSAEALNKEANAINGVGGAAKKAQKELAGFDQINRLGSKDAGGAGGGGAEIKKGPDFSGFVNDDDVDRLRKIAKLVLSIGAGLVAWKIAGSFVDSLKVLAGIALTAAGAVLYLFSWFDSLQNGIDWENLSGMIIGFGLAVGGLALAFGTVGAGIGLVIGGIGLLAVALIDWVKTGELSTEAFWAMTAGILAVGAGIALLTGSWIPLLIGAIVAVVIGIVKFGKQIKNALGELKDWLFGVFATDWIALFGPILGEPVRVFFSSLGDFTSGVFQALNGVIDFIQGVFTGNWQQAWEGIKNIFGGVFNSLVALAKAPFNGIISLVNGLLVLITSGLNKVMELLGKIPGVSTFTFTAPQIPYLAKGAVLPPNKPFMAMVGDQRNGTNIEAPLDTIKQAFLEVGGGNAEVVSLLRVIADRCGVYLDGEKLTNTVNRYQREMERAGGY